MIRDIIYISSSPRVTPRLHLPPSLKYAADGAIAATLPEVFA